MNVSTQARVVELAVELRSSLSLLVRRLRQVDVDDDLTTPQRAALARLQRGGDLASADLARLEQISPQSMGATLAELEARGFVARRKDLGDGRRILMSVTAAGGRALGERRSARVRQLADAMAAEFSDEELGRLGAAAPLLERLAERLGATAREERLR
jgi:DNA-binding MarR family transcriptional regulator